MRKAAVDIGTNSMRLLIVDEDGREMGRWEEVTGLGRGVDRSGRLAEDAVDRTIEVLTRYGSLMRDLDVGRARAVATSASRDAANREEFFSRAESALGVRPQLIPGVEEARLAYAGATADGPGSGPYLVIDIGGGSTELVGAASATSIDIGSVRLTERLLVDRPASGDQMAEAVCHVDELLATVEVEPFATAIGVAGTWTSLAAIALSLPSFDQRAVHRSRLARESLSTLVDRLAALTVEETAAIPALDPKRAPVILAGAVVASRVAERLGTGEIVVSCHDLLDGVAAAL